MFRRPQSGNWADASDEDEERALQQNTPENKEPRESAPPQEPSRVETKPATNAPPAASNYWATRNQGGAGSNAPVAENRGGDRWSHDRYESHERYGNRQESRYDRDQRPGHDRNSRYDRNESYNRNDNHYGRQDSYGRQDNYGRDSGDRYGQRGARSNGGYERRPPQERHQGYVTTVRLDGGFGFLHSFELNQDVYFHLSEVPELEAGSDSPQVQVGDELSFELNLNRRNGKESGVAIARLPKGTIVTEDISTTWSTGTITKGLPPKHKQFSGPPRREAELYGSIELTSEQEDDEGGSTGLRKHFARFTTESFTGPVQPRVGDDVQFHLAVHRHTGHKRAVDLTITQSANDKREAAIESILSTLTRETGIIASTKGNIGFIQCLDRQQDASFVNTEKEVSYSEGDNVSFFILPEEFNTEEIRGNSQRLTAIRVEKIPAGSVVFEEVVASDVRGIVQVAPKEHARHTYGKHNNGPMAGGNGQIKLISENETEGDLLSVQLNEFDVSYSPKEGDEVLVDVYLNHRRGSKVAVHVRLIKLNPEGRELGTIGSLRDDFGFIKCVDRPGDMYFRISDVMAPTGNLVLRPGAEISFDVVANRGKDGLRAARLQLQPKNTIQWESQVLEHISGVLLSVPPKFQNKKEIQLGRLRFTSTACPLEPFPDLRAQVQTAFAEENATESTHFELKQLSPSQRSALHSYATIVGGLTVEEKGKSGVLISLLADASTRPDWNAPIAEHEAEAEYSLDAIKDVRYEPNEGDTITCSIFVTKRSHHLLAKSIVQVGGNNAAVPGEGWIGVVKAEGYGFIETTHGDSVFFHLSDIVDKQRKPAEGDEVSFVIKTIEKKRKAGTIEYLAKGTLPPIEIRELEAIVLRASHRQKGSHHHHHQNAKKGMQSTAGKVKALHGEDGEEEIDGRNAFFYHIEDQTVSTAIIRPGDVVKCQIRGKNKQATHIELVTSSAKQGTVEHVGVQGGTIGILDSEEKVAYVNKNILHTSGGSPNSLNIGDKVEFAVAYPTEEGKPAMATHIVRLEGGDRKGAGINSSLRRVLKENGGVATSRMARGPDGTKGFATGWQADVHNV